MKLADFDYHLPANSIAQFPCQRRDGSRLMVIDRAARTFHHTRFSQIGEFLPAHAMLVLNDTKVMPARLIGKKLGTGGKIEFLLVRETPADAPLKTTAAREESIETRRSFLPDTPLKTAAAREESIETRRSLLPDAPLKTAAVGGVWEVLAKPQRNLKVGTQVSFGDGELLAKVIEVQTDGCCHVRFYYKGDFANVLARVGQVPLPPYIKRAPTAEDRTRYQCVYAEAEGAIAAPTAGLHFTQGLLEKLRANGIETAALTLHVGIGTFQPVKVEDIATHEMHAESIHLSAAAAAQLRNAREAGRKIVAVGTTVVRALETAGRTGTVTPYHGDSELFIYPGHQFNVVDALITNFHLPKSTLLMLVSAFADVELIRDAYQEALRQNYRFYSYGDAMLIL